MRRLLGLSAVGLGGVGILLCATAAGIGLWAAVTLSARLERAFVRLERGLIEVQEQLARVESRMKSIRTDLLAVRGAAETIAAENPELPRVRAEIERLLDRLVSAFDRADALAEVLRSGAAGLRTAADLLDQLRDEREATVRARNTADRIDRAAQSLNKLRPRIEALKSAKAAEWTRHAVTLAREAIAGSERLAEGLAAARQEVDVLRRKTAEWRAALRSWFTIAATAITLLWMWVGLGQLCLFGWGWRKLAGRTTDR